MGESAEVAVAGVKVSLDHINKKLDRIEGKIDDQDNRLRALEMGNEKQKHLNVRVQHHLDHDISVEDREGQYAKALLKWVTVILGTTILNQLPRIMELFR